MTMISIVSTSSRDAYPALLAGLQAQFGHDEAVEVAAHFLAAEAADFHWSSRVAERHLGPYEGADEEDGALERIAIAGELRHVWFAAICIVGADGAVQAMHALRLMESAAGAFAALEAMR